MLTDTHDGDEGDIEDGDRGGERPNDQRGARWFQERLIRHGRGTGLALPPP